MPCAGVVPAAAGVVERTHLARQHLTGMIAIDEQGAERGERPEHHDEVQQTSARVDEVLAVEGQQDGGDRAEQS